METETEKSLMVTRAGLEEAKLATQRLLVYCKSNDWAGYDPYDALNSRLFETISFLNSRIPRLVLTQALKRSPINIRHLALIPRTQNPKAMALFLSAFLNLSKVGFADQESLIELMIERLVALRSPGVSNWCWGYSFPWQTRTLLVPRGFPNLVCTTFVANALLDAYERAGEGRLLEMATGAADYILNELYWTGESSVAGFAYPRPSMRNNIHNGNFLGAALFSRVAKLAGEKKFTEPALRVARYSASKQNKDGSWRYGEGPKQGWVDNFHTGYNLCALHSIGRDLKTIEFDSCVRLGFDFYRNHFFLSDGTPKYFHDRVYPIDIHCVAQSIITLLVFLDFDPGNVPLAYSVFRWAMEHMWDDQGFFYYRALRFCTIRTSYMRWSQAWMLLAMSTLLREGAAAVHRTQAEQTAVSA